MNMSIACAESLEVTELKYGKEDKGDTHLVTSSDNSGGLTETVYLLKSPANAAHLAESIEQYRDGQTREYELVPCE